jgi:hypothetical protein
MFYISVFFNNIALNKEESKFKVNNRLYIHVYLKATGKPFLKIKLKKVSIEAETC